MRNKFTFLMLLLSLMMIFSLTGFSQTSVFTYQGKLSDTGTPPTGTYQMEFRLFDARDRGREIRPHRRRIGQRRQGTTGPDRIAAKTGCPVEVTAVCGER